MCVQLSEIYSFCRCLYYQYPVDRCAAYGSARHTIQRRTILIGDTCSEHSPLHGDVGSTTLGFPFMNPATETEAISKNASRPSTRTVSWTPRPPTESTPRSGKDEAVAHITLPNGASSNPVGYFSEVRQALDSLERMMRHPDVPPVPLSVEASYTAPTLAMFHRLIDFQDLRFLWPQVVRRCGSRASSLDKIASFLGRYADDLQNIAPSNLWLRDSVWECVRHSAGHIIRTACPYLAERIVEAYETCSPSSGTNRRLSKIRNQDKGAREVGIDVRGLTTMTLVRRKLETCLYETDSIVFLQDNIRSFVTLPRSTAKATRNCLKIPAENVISSIRKPPVRAGMKRITWTCRCGRALYDDFIELRAGAADELESKLRLSNSRRGITYTTISPANVGEQPKRSTTMRQAFADICRAIRENRSIRFHTENWLFPFRRPQDIELGLHSDSSSPNSERDPNYILLCIPFQRWATKLHQPRVCHINSDQELFQALRHHYYANRGSSRWKRLRKVHGLEFVMFETYKRQLVDVQARPSLPSDAMRTEYNYEPMPAEVMPPIGSNLLMRLLENPEDAEVLPVLYRKIPKKVRDKLTACPVKGSSVGWGLQFVEGMNWFAFLVYGCFGFVLSLLAALVWVALRSDVQGGFAIAGYMIAFLLFCAGISRADVDI